MLNREAIKAVRLSKLMFPNGSDYFTDGHRVSKDEPSWPCNQCVTIHNNRILGEPAKKYRFKEAGLWYVDTNGYYSDSSRMYILFDNGDG